MYDRLHTFEYPIHAYSICEDYVRGLGCGNAADESGVRVLTCKPLLCIYVGQNSKFWSNLELPMGMVKSFISGGFRVITLWLSEFQMLYYS